MSGPKTINKRIRDIRELLEQARHAIQPGPHRLASLQNLYGLAIAEGIMIPSQINTACNPLQALTTRHCGQPGTGVQARRRIWGLSSLAPQSLP